MKYISQLFIEARNVGRYVGRYADDAYRAGRRLKKKEEERKEKMKKELRMRQALKVRGE